VQPYIAPVRQGKHSLPDGADAIMHAEHTVWRGAYACPRSLWTRGSLASAVEKHPGCVHRAASLS
jgi:hypothetical protein